MLPNFLKSCPYPHRPRGVPFAPPLSLGLAITAWVCQSVATAQDDPVRFSRDILPLLSDRCFHCHGPDASHREAGLRLDLEAAAKALREDGQRILVPGSPEESILWQRITAQDEDERMPPPDAHRKPFTDDERDLFRRWILEGAPWGQHWAFEKPRRPNVPPLANHPIDAFILRRLAEQQLEPSPPAAAHTQLRRLSFDLTGLPPSPGEVKSFQERPGSWEAEVERLLQSPHHGERLAMWWLDAARYSDTDGYQGDAERTNWPWRDWVIDAFNANMPFNQFTLEQFAGDLLPEASPEQILATAFHRHHMTNGEGGRHPEESRIDYVIDRVNTTGTVWLGLTLGCTQCHSHKFDPISQRDYYSLFAFFNSIDEDGRAGKKAKPYHPYQSPYAGPVASQMAAYVRDWERREKRARKEAEARFDDWLAVERKALDPNYQAWRSLLPTSLESAEGTRLTVQQDGTVQTGGPHPVQDDYRIRAPIPAGMTRLTGWKLEVLPHESHTGDAYSRGRDGTFILTNVKFHLHTRGESQVRDLDLVNAVANAEKGATGRNYGNVKDTLDDDPRNGWTTADVSSTSGPPTAVFALSEPVRVDASQEIEIVLLHRSTEGDANIGRFRISLTDQLGETVRSLQTAPLEALARKPISPDSTLQPGLRQRLLEQFLLDDEAYQSILSHVTEARRQLDQFKKAMQPQEVMVLAERESPRDSHVLVRGVWDAKGEQVPRALLPSVLPWPEEKSQTRLDLARWLVSPENPLTTRVLVNHLWQMIFGAGLVRTPEDFGLQGERPTHPDLLDWLAVELIESGWDLRHLLRLMVTSQTYRQSSHVSPALAERDPENRWLARAPRFRLPAWMIRDHALKVSGLLNPTLGGPPVKPWQPEGVWKEIFMGRFTYRPSVGPARYRRTVYAYWRRSSGPTFLFDSAQRRVCEVSLRRTNTPLHALTLLNDVTLFEASRHLALQALGQGEEGQRVTARLRWLVSQVLSRTLTDSEQDVLQREWSRAHDHYQSHPEDAAAYLEQTLFDAPLPGAHFPDLAAYTVAASLLLNLDEAISHE